MVEQVAVEFGMPSGKGIVITFGFPNEKLVYMNGESV